MSKYSELFNYLRQCPMLENLWSIAATQDIGTRVVLPLGTSEAVQYRDNIDVTGVYECDIIPFASVYEDYQINCYSFYDAKDNNAPDMNINVLKLDEVQSICDWITEQNDLNNLPHITGEKVVSIECNPRMPQIRHIDELTNTIAYFITVRVRYVNKAKRKSIEYECTD